MPTRHLPLFSLLLVLFLPICMGNAHAEEGAAATAKSKAKGHPKVRQMTETIEDCTVDQRGRESCHVIATVEVPLPANDQVNESTVTISETEAMQKKTEADRQQMLAEMELENQRRQAELQQQTKQPQVTVAQASTAENAQTSRLESLLSGKETPSTPQPSASSTNARPDTSAKPTPKSQENSSANRLESLLGGKDEQQPPTPHKSVLDQLADKPMIEKRLAIQTEKYREQAKASCQNTLASIEQCFVQAGCKASPLPAGITPERCDEVPSPPGPIFHLLVSSDCDRDCQKRISESDRKEEEANYDAWKSKYGDLFKTCEPYRNSKSEIKSCRKQQQAACNPGNYQSGDDCVKDSMKNAPTIADAAKLFDAEYAQKANARDTSADTGSNTRENGQVQGNKSLDEMLERQRKEQAERASRSQQEQQQREMAVREQLNNMLRDQQNRRLQEQNEQTQQAESAQAKQQENKPGYIYEKVGVGGEWKQCEVEKSSAIYWAKSNRDHQAHEACNVDGWTFDRIEIQGYEQAIPCRDGKQWKAKITDSVAVCRKHQ